MKLQSPNEINKKNFDNSFSSSKKNINSNIQNEYLIKYQELYDYSFKDVELIDIFEKNNYNDNQIINDIQKLLSIEEQKIYEDKNKEEHHSPSFAHNLNSKSATVKNKYNKNKKEKEYFSNDSGIPSDYSPPPKDEEKINIINNNKLLKYKKMLFKKLKNENYTYKININKKEEINFDDELKNKTEYNTNKQSQIRLIELFKNNNIKNMSPNSKYQPPQRRNIYQDNNITREQKKKYIQYFFGNMKNYSKNNRNTNRKENIGISPDFDRRKNILNISPDKIDNFQQKVLTYKKGIKNYYSKPKSSYDFLKISFKVNNIFIPACYDNPQREQLLKMINEKKKQNPDKIIEFIFPQMPIMGSIPYYSNVYQPFNQINPYMNIYMSSPPIQFPIQNSINSNAMTYNQLNNSNNIQHIFNDIESGNLSNSGKLNQNNNAIKQIKNNQINNQLNNNLNQNSSSINNIGVFNHSNKKLSGYLSNSGNINTTSSIK